MKLRIDLEKEYGIVLEGGGARGAYQIGVWKALREAGMKIKGVAGTSVGALNGALICMDDLGKAEEIWGNMTYSTVFNVDDSMIGKLKKFGVRSMKVTDAAAEFRRLFSDRGLDIAPLKKLLEETVDEERIRRSPRDFCAASFSVTDRKEEDFDVKAAPPGTMKDIMMASAYFPGFKQEKLGGKTYLDGGSVNNVPVDLLTDRGYKDIIVIRLYGIGVDRRRFMDIPEDVTVHEIAPRRNLGGILEFDSAIQMIRLYTIGTLSPAGTGGTDVADTFKFTDAIGQALNQVGLVFGRNSGPLHLCIEPFADSPDRIKNLILAAEAILGVGVLAAVIGMIRARDEIVCHLKNAVLFLVFITLCIGSSSVTIRVEMRWVYVAYAAALLFFAYLSRVMGKAGILVLLYGCLIFPVETYYRDNWDNLYLWAPQSQYNSLAEKTYGTYGDDIFDKEIYIIGKDFEISDFNAETFLKVYAKDKTNVPKLQLIDSDMDLKEITDDMVILCEDPEHNAYNDVTEIVKRQRFDTPFGSYSDGWIDEHAKIVLTNGESSKLTLKCYYPGRLTGGETCKIKVNGRQMADLVFTDNTMYYEIPAAPYQRFTVEFSCNFYVKGAKEHRGEENLAMVVKVVDQ